MLPAECQAEKHSHVTDTPIHVFGHESKSKRLSWRVSIRANERPKIPQKDKSATLMECEADKTATADEATCGVSAQQITAMLEHNNHRHAKHSKRIPKKPMVRWILKQTLHNIKTRSYPLRTTAENDPT